MSEPTAREVSSERREALAAWLHQWVKDHGGTDLRDTGHSLALECYCGKALGITYGPTDGGSREAEAAAYFQHQAEDLRRTLLAEWSAQDRAAGAAGVAARVEAWWLERDGVPLSTVQTGPARRLRAALTPSVDHSACPRRVDRETVHYACGISVECADYPGGVYAEHVRRATGADR